MPPSSFEVIVGTPPQLAEIFCNRLALVQPVTLAVPGGSVAERFFPALAMAELDWKKLHLFWCDERAVPPDHPDSNYRVAAELLLNRAPIDPANVHRMKGEMADLDRAAAEYERGLKAVLGERSRLDVALLGVGPDGHVCSLFPGHAALEETIRSVVAVVDSPKPPAGRLTLTLTALQDAFVVIAAFGASKAAVIREALENPQSPLPVARAARQAKRALFLLDQDAAGGQTPAA